MFMPFLHSYKLREIERPGHSRESHTHKSRSTGWRCGRLMLCW